MFTKKLNRRQIRWTEFLSEFNFKIKFKFEKQNVKFDALIKKSQNFSKKTNDEKTKYQKQMMLKSKQLNNEIVKLLQLNNLKSESKNLQKSMNELKTLFEKTYQKNSIAKNLRIAKKIEQRKLFERLIKNEMKLTMNDVNITKNKIYVKKRLWIFDFEKLQLYLFKQHHNFSMQKHFDYRVMYFKIAKNYYWLNLKKTCRKYVTNCFVCRKSKAYNTQKQKLLIFLPIFERKWIDLFLNFVVNLLKCRRKNKIYENILMIVNRLIKKKNLRVHE